MLKQQAKVAISKTNPGFKASNGWEQKFKRISEMIDGFSGREIAKLAVAWQVSSIIMVYHILLKVLVLANNALFGGHILHVLNRSSPITLN